MAHGTKNNSRRLRALSLSALLASLAIVLSYVEHLVPLPIGIYGIKLGLANLAVVLALYLLGAKYAFLINALRIAISALLFGNPASLAYSVCGGLVSLALMTLAKKHLRLGTAGVSIIGGISHNAAQLCVAVLLVSNLKIAFYLPVLIAAGAITGALIGALSAALIGNGAISRLCQKYLESDKK